MSLSVENAIGAGGAGNGKIPNVPTSSIIVTGNTTRGIVVTNPTGEFHREEGVACVDVNYVGDSDRTGEVFKIFLSTGSDSEIAVPGFASPAGDIYMRTYTKSTATISNPPVLVWHNDTYASVDKILAVRLPNETFVRLYFCILKRSDLTFSGVYLIKSTDLTCTAFGSPSLIIPEYVTELLNFITLPNNQIGLCCSGLNARSNKGGIFSTTDWDTFTFRSLITPMTSNNVEGAIINDPKGGGKLIAIVRTAAGGVMQQAVSYDWGWTWGSFFNSNLGQVTGVKVKPCFIRAAGSNTRIVGWFYDRGNNRGMFVQPTLFDDAFTGVWGTAYLATVNLDGNGGLFCVTDNLTSPRYLSIQQNGTSTPNDLCWCVYKDIYQ